MKLGLGTPFTRAVAVALHTGLAALPAYSQDVDSQSSISESTQLGGAKLEELFIQAGVTEEEILPAIDIIIDNLSTIGRKYIEPHEMEPLEALVVKGVEERINIWPEKLVELQGRLAEIRSQLDAYKTEILPIAEEHGVDITHAFYEPGLPDKLNTPVTIKTLDDLLKRLSSIEEELTSERKTLEGDDLNTSDISGLIDAAIFAGVTLSQVEEYARHAENNSVISSLSLVEAGLNYALKSLDPHSTYTAPQWIITEGSTMTPLLGIGASVEVDGESKYLLQKGLLVRSVLHPDDNTPAYQAGLQPGDLITHIDGEAIAGWTSYEAISVIRGLLNASVALSVERDNIELPEPINITRTPYERANVTSRIVADNYVYIHMGTFMDDQLVEKVRSVIAKHQEELGGADNVAGYILSVENNGGGLLNESVDLNNSFIDGDEFDRSYGFEDRLPQDVLRANTVVSTQGRKGLEDVFYSEVGDIISGKPMAVLINSGSASASEIFSLTMQDYGRALIVGQTSFGKGSVQVIGPAVNDGQLKLTVQRYYAGRGSADSPFGRSIQGLGVQPDIVLPFLEASKVSEAGLANTIATPDDAHFEENESSMCDRIEKDVDINSIDDSFIDPRSGEIHYSLICAVAALEIENGIAFNPEYNVTIKGADYSYEIQP